VGRGRLVEVADLVVLVVLLVVVASPLCQLFGVLTRSEAGKLSGS